MMGQAVLRDGRETLCYRDQPGSLNLGNAFAVCLEDIVKSRKHRDAAMLGFRRRLPLCSDCNQIEIVSVIQLK